VDRAFRICQAGLKIHPNYGSAHVVMAKINLDKGLYDWAEMETNKSIELDGSSRVADILLAEIYVYRGELLRATNILNPIKSIDPGNSQVNELLALVARLGSKSPIAKQKRAEKTASDMDKRESNEDGSSAEANEDKISINEFLEKLITIGGVQGALILNEEGLVSEQRWHDNVSVEKCAVMAAEVVKFLGSQVGFVKYGALQNILIEAQDYIINVIPLEYRNMLLIKATPKTNLGSIKLKVNPLLEKLDYKI